jgi:hypothetical protein
MRRLATFAANILLGVALTVFLLAVVFSAIAGRGVAILPSEWTTLLRLATFAAVLGAGSAGYFASESSKPPGGHTADSPPPVRVSGPFGPPSLLTR